MKEEIQERLSRILLKYISKGIVNKRDTLITEIKKTPRGFIYNIESGNEKRADKTILKVSEESSKIYKKEGKRLIILFPIGIFLLTRLP